jgi:hypothetical protein
MTAGTPETDSQRNHGLLEIRKKSRNEKSESDNEWKRQINEKLGRIADELKV